MVMHASMYNMHFMYLFIYIYVLTMSWSYSDDNYKFCGHYGRSLYKMLWAT